MTHGLKAKLDRELAADRDFLRKLRPRLIAARARGATPRSDAAPHAAQLPPRPHADGGGSARGGPNPFAVLGVAFAVGVALAKAIDWRGHAHPRG